MYGIELTPLKLRLSRELASLTVLMLVALSPRLSQLMSFCRPCRISSGTARESALGMVEQKQTTMGTKVMGFMVAVT